VVLRAGKGKMGNRGRARAGARAKARAKVGARPSNNNSDYNL
jgi:hypothetical protein